MADDGLTVKGMREFRAGLRKAGGPAMTKFVSIGHKHIASVYLAKIKTRAAVTYRPSANIARALSARGSQRKASIAMAPGKDPRIFGAEFGAQIHWIRVGPRFRTGRGMPASAMRNRVFTPWTGNQWSGGEGGGEPGANVGNAVFPVLRESQEEITADYLTHIEKAFFDAFPERG